MKKVVFDTVIFVRSLINPHSIYGKIVFKSSAYQLFVSKQILIEILEVLKRPEITSKYHFIEEMDTRKVLDILSNAEIVEVKNIPKVSRDVKDNKFLATAQAAGADYLISEDGDLLDLEEYKGIKIIDGPTFLKVLQTA